jgi:hypothetical protein
MIHAHILAFNEERIMPFTMRHYKSFCSRVTVHDFGSSDSTKAVALAYGAEIQQWDCGGKFDDLLNKKVKNECWVGSDADWVICVDTDEFLYWPEGVEKSFAAYSVQGLPIIKPSGYEMLSDVYPTCSGQIYDEVKMGGRDDFWYGKSVCFSPKLVAEVDFGAGAHVVTVKLKDGKTLNVNHDWPLSLPVCQLLHFHQIMPIEEIAAKYEATKARMSENNIKNNWGWHGVGLVHATDKRNSILAHLEQVIK